MNRFTGNKLTGYWIFKEPCGTYGILSVPEMLDDDRIVWIMTPDSGDLHWPHIQFPEQQPQPLTYNNDD